MGYARSEHSILGELLVRARAHTPGGSRTGPARGRRARRDGLAGDPAADEHAAPVEPDQALAADRAELGAGRVEAVPLGPRGRPRAVAGPPPRDRRDVADRPVRAERVVPVAP